MTTRERLLGIYSVELPSGIQYPMCIDIVDFGNGEYSYGVPGNNTVFYAAMEQGIFDKIAIDFEAWKVKRAKAEEVLRNI
jgi:hypothetical protein